MGHATWTSAIDDVVKAYDAVGGVVFSLNTLTGEFADWTSVGLDQSQKYMDEMNAINPRMHYSMSNKNTHTFTDLDILSSKEMARHEFYRWLELYNGLQHFIGARIRNDGPIATFLSVEFDCKSAPPDKSAVSQFALLGQQCSNAIQLQAKPPK